jgi:integrase
VARTVRDANLGTREARTRLEVRGRPYWRSIEPGLHLGYRRLAGKPGTWCARRYVGEQHYLVEGLKGVADDYSDADGGGVLSYAQAQRALLERKPKPGGPYTVRQAVADYLEYLTHHKKTAKDAAYRFEAFVLPALGDVPVAELTTDRLRRWLNSLAATPRRVRSPKGESPRHDKADGSDEGKRRRRASANRVLINLRACLNLAWRDKKVSSDDAWRRVQPFANTDSPRLRFLSADECRRLRNAAQDEDFRNLIDAALSTGCRYGELAALVVSDFHPDSGTLLIRTSKSGKSRTVWLTEEAQRLFARWSIGRAGTDLLLPRGDGGRWDTAHQSERMRAACQRAGIVPPVSFHILRHTHASHLAMKGVPLAVIGEQLGHADQRMTKRYAHLSKSYVGDTIREHALTLGIAPDRKIAPLKR